MKREQKVHTCCSRLVWSLVWTARELCSSQLDSILVYVPFCWPLPPLRIFLLASCTPLSLNLSLSLSLSLVVDMYVLCKFIQVSEYCWPELVG